MPDGLVFPSELSDRIWFEPHQQQLVYRGFMSRLVFSRLGALSNDAQYQCALQHLFQVYIYSNGPYPEHASRRWIARLAVTGVAVTGSLAALGSVFLARIS